MIEKKKRGLQDVDCLLYYKDIGDGSLDESSVHNEIVQQLKKFLKVVDTKKINWYTKYRSKARQC